MFFPAEINLLCAVEQVQDNINSINAEITELQVNAKASLKSGSRVQVRGNIFCYLKLCMRTKFIYLSLVLLGWQVFVLHFHYIRTFMQATCIVTSHWTIYVIMSAFLFTNSSLR